MPPTRAAADLRVQFAHTQVIKEEKRVGSAGHNIIHTMVDKVLADAVVPTHGKSDFKFGAHAVDAGDDHRIGIFLEVKGKETGK